jgi:hypothetical protein
MFRPRKEIDAMKEGDPLDEEFRQEAERLSLLDEETQRRLIAEQRAIAANPKVPQRDREYALARAKALQRHLQKKRNKS